MRQSEVWGGRPARARPWVVAAVALAALAPALAPGSAADAPSGYHIITEWRSDERFNIDGGGMILVLPNGNLLVGVVDAEVGGHRVIEWTPEKDLVWAFPREGAMPRIVTQPQRLPDGRTFLVTADAAFLVRPDGTIEWSFTRGGAITARFYSGAYLVDETAVIGTSAGTFHVNHDGDILWHDRMVPFRVRAAGESFLLTQWGFTVEYSMDHQLVWKKEGLGGWGMHRFGNGDTLLHSVSLSNFWNEWTDQVNPDGKIVWHGRLPCLVGYCNWWIPISEVSAVDAERLYFGRPDRVVLVHRAVPELRVTAMSAAAASDACAACMDVTVTVHNSGMAATWNSMVVALEATRGGSTEEVAAVEVPKGLAPNEEVTVTLRWDVTEARGGSWTLRAIADARRLNPERDDSKNDRLLMMNLPPQSTLSMNGPEGDNGWYRGPVQVDVRVDTNVPFTSRCALDGALLDSCRMTLVDDGEYDLTYWSVDATGAAEAPRSARVRVDATPPALALHADGTRGDHGWWRGPVAFSAHASDATSGVRAAACAEGGGSESATLSLRGDGDHRVTCAAADAAGNAARIEARHRVDGTPPATALAAPLPPIQGPGGVAELVAEDATSGVAVTRYALRDDEWVDYSGPIDLSGLPSGDHRLAFASTDVAGNAEPAHEARVVVDADAPVAELLRPRAGSLTTATRYVESDADGDGAPDAVEAALGTDPEDASTAPEFARDAPRRAFVTAGAVVPVRLAATDLVVNGVASGLASVEVRVDGAPLAQAADGTFEWDTYCEKPGVHALEWRVADGVGNERRGGLLVHVLGATLCDGIRAPRPHLPGDAP